MQEFNVTLIKVAIYIIFKRHLKLYWQCFACFLSYFSFQLILWWKGFGATAAGLIRWVHPDVCAEDCGGCSTHWPAGWGPAHIWRGGGTGEWLDSVPFYHMWLWSFLKLYWLSHLIFFLQPRYLLKFEQIYLSKPTHWERDGAPSPMMPNEARLRNLTWVLNL